MLNYIYQPIDNLVIDEDLFEIFSDSNNFSFSQEEIKLEIGLNLDYTKKINKKFFKVFIEDTLLGYIWFDAEMEDYGSIYGSKSLIEISFAKSIKAKDLEKKVFIDKVLQDLDETKNLLPAEWFDCSQTIWIGVVQPKNKNKEYIMTKLIDNSFVFNSNEDAFVRPVVS